MRLIDQVRIGHPSNFDVWPTVGPMWKLIRDNWTLDDAVPIDITNVYDWMLSEWNDVGENNHKRQRFWDEIAKDTKPSFDSAWFEWRMNKMVRRDDGSQMKVDGRAIWAIANFGTESPNRWAMLLFERHDGIVLLSHIWFVDFNKMNFIPADDDFQHGESGFVRGVMVPVVLAQNLMHCENVKVERTEMPPKLAKKIARKHGYRPVTKWHAVKIEPMKKVLRGSGGVRGIGVEKAMHVVRGNFAEYTEDKKLFGKVVGKVFRPMHVRGNKALGVKKPGYVVEPPKEAA